MKNTDKQVNIVISVCRGMACSDAHSADVLKEAENCLGIKEGETTVDEKITLKKHFCFGRCAIGPNVKINQDYLANQTPSDLRVTLNTLKNKPD